MCNYVRHFQMLFTIYVNTTFAINFDIYIRNGTNHRKIELNSIRKFIQNTHGYTTLGSNRTPLYIRT